MMDVGTRVVAIKTNGGLSISVGDKGVVVERNHPIIRYSKYTRVTWGGQAGRSLWVHCDTLKKLNTTVLDQELSEGVVL